MNAPSNKIYAVGAAGAAVTIIVWGIQTFTGATVPADVALAMSTVISVLAGYFMPNRA